MAIEKTNIINSSRNFDGNVAEFQRLLDNPQALGRYVLDKANMQSFFSNFPGLAVTKPVNSNVGDEVLLDEKWNVVAGGPGMPGPYKGDRQLSGNEAITDAAFRRDRMTVGLRRYAVAVENYLQSNLLPKEMVSTLRNTLTDWATMMNDLDVSTMVFRDYPYYISETSTLSGDEIDRRVLSMFGRGVLNDVSTSPVTIFPNGKTDIEELDNTDTLSDLFLEQLQQLGDQELGMTPLSLQDERPFFGLIVGDPDIQNFYKNSSTTFTSTLTESFSTAKWDNPLFKKTLGEFANVRMFKYSWLAANDGRDAFASWESVYKHIAGSPFIPQAKVLAIATGDETISNLRVWNRGDYSTNPGDRDGLDGNDKSLNIYVTVGAEHFPFFNGGEIGVAPNTVKVGADSFNKALVGSYDGDSDGNADDIEGLDYSDVTNGNYVGRFELGESTAANGKYKILYTGPYYVGTIQIGDNKTPFAQVQLVYRFKVQALYKWDGSKYVLITDIGAEKAALKAFAGIDTNTNTIKIDGSTSGIAMQKNRKVHIFNTVRTILLGKAMYNEAEIEKLGQIKQEERDYGAVTGWGITVSKGRKLKRATDGSIRSYAVVIFKRPPVL